MTLFLLRKGVLLFAITGLALVGTAYSLAFLSLETDLDFLTWSLGRAEAGLWDSPDESTPFKAVMGLTRVFIHVSALFASETLTNLATNATGTDRLVEVVYLARTALTSPLASALPVLALTYALALFALFASGLCRIKTDQTTQLLIASIVSYTALVIIWEASNNEFWLHIVIFLFLLVAPSLATRRRVALTAVACAATLNFTAGIRPLSDPSNDYWAYVRGEIAVHIPANGVIVTDCPWLCQKYLRLGGHRVFAPEDRSYQPLWTEEPSLWQWQIGWM